MNPGCLRPPTVHCATRYLRGDHRPHDRAGRLQHAGMHAAQAMPLRSAASVGGLRQGDAESPLMRGSQTVCESYVFAALPAAAETYSQSGPGGPSTRTSRQLWWGMGVRRQPLRWTFGVAVSTALYMGEHACTRVMAASTQLRRGTRPDDVQRLELYLQMRYGAMLLLGTLVPGLNGISIVQGMQSLGKIMQKHGGRAVSRLLPLLR